MALIQPGDTILGLSLAAGGHLTHGAPPNMSGKWFKATHYGVRAEDGRIDFDEVERQAEAHRPKLIICGGSAYPRIIDFARFRVIADKVGAYLMVDMAHFAGLVAGGVHPSPLPHAHVVTTTTHKTLRGPRGGMILTNDEAIAKKIDSAMFPGLQGGPLMHVIAAKAVAFGEALQPSFARLFPSSRRQRQGAVRDAGCRRAGDRLRRHRHASDAGRSAPARPDRARRREGAGARWDDLQQERHSVRPASADRDLGGPPRLAGGDHARFRRRRISPDRPLDRRGAARPGPSRQRQRRDREARAPRRHRVVRALSGVSAGERAGRARRMRQRGAELRATCVITADATPCLAREATRRSRRWPASLPARRPHR